MRPGIYSVEYITQSKLDPDGYESTDNVLAVDAQSAIDKVVKAVSKQVHTDDDGKEYPVTKVIATRVVREWEAEY